MWQVKLHQQYSYGSSTAVVKAHLLLVLHLVKINIVYFCCLGKHRKVYCRRYVTGEPDWAEFSQDVTVQSPLSPLLTPRRFHPTSGPNCVSNITSFKVAPLALTTCTQAEATSKHTYLRSLQYYEDENEPSIKGKQAHLRKRELRWIFQLQLRSCQQAVQVFPDGACYARYYLKRL